MCGWALSPITNISRGKTGAFHHEVFNGQLSPSPNLYPFDSLPPELRLPLKRAAAKPKCWKPSPFERSFFMHDTTGGS